MAETTRIKYYNLNKIKRKGAQYNVIYGKRSNGKTYAALEEGLKQYHEHGYEMAYIRRWDDDLRGRNGQTIFKPLEENGLIEKYTGGEWTDVFYQGRTWYFCRYDADGNRIKDTFPFCYAFALNTMEHTKSTSYPKVHTIIFDEFLSRSSYLPDEFVIFMNVLSTIVRNRANITIYMLGNSVNKYCPYFEEMGLKNVKDQKQGTIDVYRYGESDLKVAVEYTASHEGSTRAGDTLFAFNNPKLQMITGGDWEIDIYPHLPYYYKPKNVIFNYFIKWDGEILHCEIICGGYTEEGKEVKNIYYTYIHRKTTDIKDEERDIIYSPDPSPHPNHYTRLSKPIDKRSQKIWDFFKKDKVFFQTNEVGEVVRNYLVFCDK